MNIFITLQQEERNGASWHPIAFNDSSVVGSNGKTKLLGWYLLTIGQRQMSNQMDRLWYVTPSIHSSNYYLFNKKEYYYN